MLQNSHVATPVWNAGYQNGWRLGRLNIDEEERCRRIHEVVMIAVSLYYPVEEFYAGLREGLAAASSNAGQSQNN